MGYRDGREAMSFERDFPGERSDLRKQREAYFTSSSIDRSRGRPKRKLSAWQKFVKANSRKKEFRYRDGKLNLKKMGVAYRRKKRR